jgi:predicted dehydrogenase
MKTKKFNRRQFIATSGLAAGALLAAPAYTMTGAGNRRRIALVGTGIRGTGFWGRTLMDRYPDLLEFAGLCDINPGRLEFGRQHIGVECPTFTDFDEMLETVKPDTLIVTTVDATHHEFIIKGLERGMDVITEKPLTTDEKKCQAILEAERRSGKKLIVGFNYRWAPHATKIKELLAAERVGKLTSVDFHWYLNVYHGASYFRRWHGLRDRSGTLLVHKATHHFDLLNWWINSDPVEVHAFGELEHYGHNNAYRSEKCRGCPHQEKCKFFWDITRDEFLMNLYARNEHHDGYIRDRCLWNEDIDIYDKMAVQIKYANNVQVSYSLTTYSPYEGWRVAFNGFNGRIDSWQDIPWRKEEKVNQAALHEKEMVQQDEKFTDYDEVAVMDNFSDYEIIRIPRSGGGHGGGDIRLQNKIFKDPKMADPFNHSAGSRDGAMSVLIGIAARKSIEEKRPVRIEELTDLVPMPGRV